MMGHAPPKPQKRAFTHNITPEGEPPKSSIYDCAVHLIHCPKHDKVAVALQPNGITWLPFTPLSPKQSWNDSALNGSYHVMSGPNGATFDAIKRVPPFLKANILQVLRVQLPDQENTYFTRIIFYVRLNPNTRNQSFKCCQESDRIQWLTCASLADGKFSKPFWGPELFEFCRTIKQSSRPTQKIQGYSLQMARSMMSGGKARNLDEELLISADVTRTDVDRLFADYVDHCFPSFLMSFWSFKIYVTKHGFEMNENRLNRLFRAFNQRKNGFITFHELLTGLAAMDPKAEHNEARLAFVFRFYDKSHAGALSGADLGKLVRDINPKDSEEVYQAKVKEAIAKFKISGDVPAIKFADLLTAVTNQQLTGTSSLCRSSKEVFPLIARAINRRKWKQRQADSQVNRLDLVVKKKFHTHKCLRCTKNRKFRIVPQLEDGMAETGQRTSQVAINDIDDQLKAPMNLKIFASELLVAIGSFDKGTIESPRGVLMGEEDRLIQLVDAIQTEAFKLFTSKLGKCVEVASPCFVIGDIHGNLEDLFTLEKRLWRNLPLGPNLLFLGDYVDRGKWGVECALYVLALKVLFPHKVTLLRGNHEVECVQRKYSFLNECTNKYPKQGEQIFLMLNKVFARMPVTAVLDDAIYCAHGGIPHLQTTLKAIREMPQDITNESDSELFWEIVWSDPINEEQYRMTCALFQQDPVVQRGYVRNTKRGAAWFFAEEAADNFFKTNNLTHIIRAHEVPLNGFTFHFGDRCTTVFSCSHYFEDNKCAVLFVDQERIRVLRIDTTTNGAPFEQ